MSRTLYHRLSRAAQPRRPILRYGSHSCGSLLAVLGEGGYDLVPGIYGLFLELVTYGTGGFLFEVEPGPKMEINGICVVILFPPPPGSTPHPPPMCADAFKGQERRGGEGRGGEESGEHSILYS